MSGAGSEWPWSALGIAPSADKVAIHAAHDAKRAELNAAAARISEFADLTAAREKALFLASEMQRQQEREGIAPPLPPPVDPPRPLSQDPPEPEPEVAAEEWEPGGRFSSASDRLQDIGDTLIEPNVGFHPPPPDPGEEADGEWEHAGEYRSDLQRENAALAQDLARITGFDHPHRDADGKWTGAGPTPFLQRYSLDKYGVAWVFGFFFLLAMCSAIK